MKNTTQNAMDARQTPEWGRYLQSIGWQRIMASRTQVMVRKFPFLDISLIKIQHAFGPFPFKQIDAIARHKKSLVVLIEPHIVGFDATELKSHGFFQSKMLLAFTATIKIDLAKSREKLFKSLSENARRNIKKAQKEKLRVKIYHMKDKKNWEHFDEFYDLLKNLTKMKKFYVPSRDEYNKKMTAFKNTSYLVFAYENEQPIAVVWYVHFGNVIAYFQTGITRRGYETFANYLLVWEGFLLGKRLKKTVFDFEAIYDERFPKNVPKHIGYSEFKKRFHGDVILYPQPWVKTYNILGAILHRLSTLS